jgi:hypothetical protein
MQHVHGVDDQRRIGCVLAGGVGKLLDGLDIVIEPLFARNPEETWQSTQDETS